MQKINNNFKTTSYFFVGIIAIVCLMATLLGITSYFNIADNSQPIIANAATTINNASDFETYFKTSGSISGDYILGADFTVSSSHISEATFSGKLNGNGHTITISGTHTASYTTTASTTCRYFGFLCGNMMNGSISNLNIVVNGTINAKGTNSIATSGDYNNGAAYSTTLYIGVLAGKAQNAQLNDVNVTIGSNGIVSGIGLDGNTNAETHASGQGAVVGGLFGDTQGASLNNVTFTNNGSIWARGENKVGGYYEIRTGNIFNWTYVSHPIFLTDPTRPDRVSAGGLFGEASLGTTTINNLTLDGSGYTGARAWGEGNGDWTNGSKASYVHNINFAGGIVGYAKGGKINITGLLYKYSGVVFVGQESRDSKYYSGTIVGKATANNDITINYLWRNPNEGLSGYGYNTYDNTSYGPSAGNLSSTSVLKRLSSGGTVSSVATQDSAQMVSIPNATETSINSIYDGSQIATGAGIITAIKDQYISISVTTSSSLSYYISSIYYKKSNDEACYINYYEKEISKTASLSGEEYNIPVSCTNLTVYLTKIVKQSLYIKCAGDKEYNRRTGGISFTGKPTADSPGLLPNLRWIAIANDNLSSSYTVKGDLGSEMVVSDANVGTYKFVLYKQDENGALEPAVDGDNLGPNKTNAPTIIYQFDGASYTYSISQAKLGLRAKGSFSRPYNGKNTVLSDDLIINKHYEFYRLDDNSILVDETPNVTIGAGYFYDSNNEKTSAVSTGLTVVIEGFAVSGNYTLDYSPTTSLTLTGCAITPKSITVSWSSCVLVYDGTLRYPEATPVEDALIGDDTVELKTTVYSDEQLFNLVSKTDVGYYWAKVEFASPSANYKFDNGFISQEFEVIQKELNISWTNFKKDYTGSNYNVNYSITDEATNVAQGDSIGLSVTYSFIGETDSTLLKNAGSYLATASITNTNYYINPDDVVFGDGENEYITIIPIEIKLIYYTGSDNDYTENHVEDLIYINQNYIGHSNGLHAKLHPDYVGMNILQGHINLRYNVSEVKNVGTYDVTGYLDYLTGGNNSEDFIITNYAVSNATVKIKVVQREISLEISSTRSFEYDMTLNDINDIAISCEKINNLANETIALTKKIYYYNNDTKGDVATTSNVGKYLIEFEIDNNDNYVISSTTKEASFEIYQYDISVLNRVTLSSISGSYEYDGSPIVPQINMQYFVRLNNGSYLTNEVDYAVSYDNNTDAGNAAIVKVEGQGNYKGYLTTNFTISKRILGVNFTSSNSITYNGQVITINYKLTNLAANANHDTIKSYTNVNYSSTPRYVNDYVAVVYFTSSQKNYELPSDEDERSFDFKITPLDISVTYSNSEPKIYNGTSQNLTVETTGFFGGDDVALVDRYYSKSLKKYESPKNVGLYDVEVELSGEHSKNYKITNASMPNYQIKARPIQLEFKNEEYNKTYIANDLSLKIGASVDVNDYWISASTPAVVGENVGIYLTYQPTSGGAAISDGNLVSAGEYSILCYLTNSNYSLMASEINPIISISPAILKLYVNEDVKNSTYNGENSKVNIPYGWVDGYGPIGTDNFNAIRSYYNVNTPNVLITSGIYEVGTYKMNFELPKDNTNTNNYVIDSINLEEIQSFEYTIAPRPITVTYKLSDQKIYDTESIECTQDAVLNITSGLLVGDVIHIDVKATKKVGNTDNYEPVDIIKDAGTYVFSFALSENDLSDNDNKNYKLADGNSTKKTYVILKKEIAFFADSFSKIYGNYDTEILQQVNGLKDESILVTFTRNSGENVGQYDFIVDSLTIIQDGENEIIAQNYDIKFASGTFEQTHGKYEIKQRTIDFNPDGDTTTEAIDPFYFDYLDPIVGSDKLIYRHSVDTALFGTIYVEINLAPKDPSIVNMGTYDLSTEFEYDNANFLCQMIDGAHIGKIVILGRSVQLKFDDIYITFGDEEPNYYDYLTAIEIEKCDQNIQNDYNAYVEEHGSAEGFDWRKYISITREQSTSNMGIELPYKSNGYTLTIAFLKKDGLEDTNYRAVRIITNDDGTTSLTSNPAKLFVNKFDLNTIYGDGAGLIKPVVSTSKNYDGKVYANITNANILSAHESHQLSVSAEYDNAEAGSRNKTITVKYSFKIAEFGDNYILPNNFVYTETATINPLTVNVIIDQENLTLTYGEKPNITLSYEGFIKVNETYQSIETEGIMVSGVYADGKSLDTIRNIGSYSIKLKLDACLTKNYVVNYEHASITVAFSPKNIALIEGAPYEKAVDGTTDVIITSDNYVLQGLLEQDKYLVYIAQENITAMLDSAEPGKTFIRMSITELSGDKKDNYSLSNYALTIQAEIKKLADVTLNSASFDFDNSAKALVPTLENVMSGVRYYLEYTGINVQYATSRQAPKKAGTYKVVCYVHNEQGTYNRAMAEAELTINKIAPTLYFTGTFTQTYGSFTAIEATVKASGLEEKIDVTYSFVDEYGVFPTFPPAGKHTVKATYEETANYLSVSAERSLEIKAKSLTITFDDYKGLVYNGFSRENDITITFNGVVPGDTCTPVRLFNANSVKNAGTYRLIVSPSNPSYIISGANSIEFTIAKKTIKVSVGNDVVTSAGVAPEFTLQYDGFVENEDESDLQTAPSVKLTSGQVGVNLVKYNEGYDENYSFTYIDCVYTITYASENEGKTNYTPYIAAGVAVGSVGIIFLIAYMVKIYNYRSMTRYVAKRVIKKSMFKSKNIK